MGRGKDRRGGGRRESGNHQKENLINTTELEVLKQGGTVWACMRAHMCERSQGGRRVGR